MRSLVLFNGFLSDLLQGGLLIPYGGLILMALDVINTGLSSAEVAIAKSHGGGGRVRIAP
jgi:hypothetical protein